MQAPYSVRNKSEVFLKLRPESGPNPIRKARPDLQLCFIICRYTDIIIRLFSVMFAVLINQIEHLSNSSIRSYCVGQVYVTNEIIQLSEQKLINKNKYE